MAIEVSQEDLLTEQQIEWIEQDLSRFDKALYSFDYNDRRFGYKRYIDTKTEGKTIMVNEGDGFVPFEIRGADLGTGIPGYFATDYAIDKKTYLEWFKLIQEMGAKCIRVYTMQAKDFYEAVYQYNKDNDTPLYILHGVWVDDYIQFSHADAFDPRFLLAFQRDCKAFVAVVYGKACPCLSQLICPLQCRPYAGS